MMKIHSMRGFSILSLIIIALLVIICTIITIRLVPPYMHYFAVKDAMEQMAADPNVAQMSPLKLKDTFSRKLEVNYITSVSPEALVIEKQNNKPEALTIKYEERVHLIANIDAVLTFENEVKFSEKTKP
ncbi:MAG: DUF4845 domain-containing protein [Proteobacteria bacterium]|nr:DUF4845 domain-containing protein [Pseudomonadota bacterium]